MALPGADPAAALKEIGQEVQKKFDESGMAKVEEFTDKIDDIIQKAKNGPRELMDDAKKKFEEFKGQIDALLKNPSSCAPSGGMAACSDFYGKSVVEKLGSVSEEASSLAINITRMANDLEVPLKKLSDTLTEAMESLDGSLKALAKLPKLIQKEIEGKDSLDDIGKINTAQMKKALDYGDVDGPLNMIIGLKFILGNAMLAVAHGIEALADFIDRAPDMVRGAFDVPSPLCFMTSVLLSQAPKAMTELLGMIDKLKDIKLKPIIDILDSTMGIIVDLDVSQVKIFMTSFLVSAGDLVDRLDKTVTAARISANPAGAFGSVG